MARSYHSDAKPAGVVDLGAHDDKTRRPSRQITTSTICPATSFVVPAGYNPLGAAEGTGRGRQVPGNARPRPPATTCFRPAPSVNDWFETVKLNYGVDYKHARQTHFEPVPDTWLKMRDILLYWAGKDVDGFRCDMAEMVPVEFWAYVIPEIKKAKPGIIFIGEAYGAKEYSTYLTKGHFDFLYDKVGLYDGLRRLMRQEGTTDDITHVWKTESRGFGSHMLRFLENHDEQRIASTEFAGDPRRAIPAMTVIGYPGQRPGDALHRARKWASPPWAMRVFFGDDGRTSIFDYWGVPRAPEMAEPGQDGRRQAERRPKEAARFL
ncbi:MAG: alpha-amylase family glycosyl hydrolase [Hymenobacter sp.]